MIPSVSPTSTSAAATPHHDTPRSTRVGPTGVTTSHDAPGNCTVNTFAASRRPRQPPRPQLTPAVTISQRRRHRHRVLAVPGVNAPAGSTTYDTPVGPDAASPSAPSPHQRHTSPDVTSGFTGDTGVHTAVTDRTSPATSPSSSRPCGPPRRHRSGHTNPGVIQRRRHRHVLAHAYGTLGSAAIGDPIVVRATSTSAAEHPTTTHRLVTVGAHRRHHRHTTRAGSTSTVDTSPWSVRRRPPCHRQLTPA